MKHLLTITLLALLPTFATAQKAKLTCVANLETYAPEWFVKDSTNLCRAIGQFQDTIGIQAVACPEKVRQQYNGDHTICFAYEYGAPFFPKYIEDVTGKIWQVVPCDYGIENTKYWSGIEWYIMGQVCLKEATWKFNSFKVLPVAAKPVFSQSKYQGA
jgi:acyl-ACP thioesterase